MLTNSHSGVVRSMQTCATKVHNSLCEKILSPLGAMKYMPLNFAQSPPAFSSHSSTRAFQLCVPPNKNPLCSITRLTQTILKQPYGGGTASIAATLYLRNKWISKLKGNLLALLGTNKCNVL